jgi:rubrerythrin
LSNTNTDLKNAFAGESQANRKYLAFAKKAEIEGFPEVAKLFRAAAESETIHAHYHFNALGGVGTTANNLQEAIKGEAYEHTEMYPAMIAHAKAEGNKVAELGFDMANKVEKVHEKKFAKALEAVTSGNDLPKKKVWICEVCGHLHEGDDGPDQCPICHSPKGKFHEAK